MVRIAKFNAHPRGNSGRRIKESRRPKAQGCNGGVCTSAALIKGKGRGLSGTEREIRKNTLLPVRRNRREKKGNMEEKGIFVDWGQQEESK